ncbi:hypothetical protein MRX96_049478 [Rhipicephalus microplus]
MPGKRRTIKPPPSRTSHAGAPADFVKSTAFLTGDTHSRVHLESDCNVSLIFIASHQQSVTVPRGVSQTKGWPEPRHDTSNARRDSAFCSLRRTHSPPFVTPYSSSTTPWQEAKALSIRVAAIEFRCPRQKTNVVESFWVVGCTETAGKDSHAAICLWPWPATKLY